MLELLKIILYYPFLNLLNFFVWLIPGHHVVWGIIFLTIVVRLILLLPTKRQAESQRKMQQLAPLLAELKEEYGNDQQALAKAQMELYKKNEINPLSSCLPLLIQLPILIVLYRAILQGINTNGANLYSWMPRPDSVQTVLFGIDLLKPDKTFIIAIIAAALQYVQIKMTLPKVESGKPVDQTVAVQRNMVYFFPALTLVAVISVPAGLGIYWIIGSIFSITQQYFVNKKKLDLQGVASVVEKADKDHPGYKHSKEVQQEVTEEKESKKGVTVTVRRKKK